MENNNSLPNSKVFIAGTLFCELKNRPGIIDTKYHHVRLMYPSRLEAMSLDPSKIAGHFEDNIYPAGQIDFCVNICKTIDVRLRTDKEIHVTDGSPRRSLILHSVKLMQNALCTDCGFDIDIKNDLELKHCGLGSSSSIIQGVAAAISELFGNPIKPLDLIRFLIGNHGEEIDDDDDHLIQVQSVGGSGVCGHFEGGLIINAGKAVPIFRANLPDDLKVVIGIPKSFTYPDSNELMNKELENMSGFRKTGDKFAEKVAYRLVNEVIPGLVEDDYKPCKDLIFDYRWNMGSIRNCSFVCPGIIDIAEKLRPLRNNDDIKFMSLSSVGPGFFIITHKPEMARKIFSELDMNVYTTDIFNDKYKVLEKK